MKHLFVEHIPEKLEAGVLYVSLEYDTVVHSCACGCGNEVVTPLSPAEWSVNYDGRSISLSPSIGNWEFPCRSHYWIRRGKVDWAARWSNERIASVQEKDRVDREKLYEKPKIKMDSSPAVDVKPKRAKPLSVLEKIRSWLG